MSIHRLSLSEFINTVCKLELLIMLRSQKSNLIEFYWNQSVFVWPVAVVDGESLVQRCSPSPECVRLSNAAVWMYQMRDVKRTHICWILNQLV